MATLAERNIAAEARGVEAGHRAFAQPDGSVLVKSDTYPGKRYRVTYTASHVGAGVAFTCTPEGEAAYRDDHLRTIGAPGVLPCMHAGLAARRLEREGLARFAEDGRWVATDRAAVAEPPRRVAAGYLDRLRL